jgi:hypothetical protein
MIHEALYSVPREKEEIIGPLKISEGEYIILQVEGWTERIQLRDEDVRQRYKDVETLIKTNKAQEHFRAYVHDLMKGKRFEFSPDMFREMVTIFGSYYLKSDQEKREAFKQQFWLDRETFMLMDNAAARLEAILDEPLLKYQSEVWTVQTLLDEIETHPLVFRKKKLDKSNFAEQFRYAVADLIRDKELTRELYKKGYDRVNIVERNVSMWRENLLALYQRNTLLRSRSLWQSFHEDYLDVIENHLNGYVDSLQSIYQDDIFVNTDAFNNIQLTSIDFVAIQENVPFPVMVPQFPVITTDHMLDYGKKMTSVREN